MEKIVHRILWCLTVCLGGYLAAWGLIRVREHPSEKVREFLAQAYETVGEEAVSWYLPACFYEEENRTGWLETVWDAIWEHVPLVTYLRETEETEILVEDESTYHEIIEANGKTITDRLLAENQGKTAGEANSEHNTEGELPEEGTDGADSETAVEKENLEDAVGEENQAAQGADPDGTSAPDGQTEAADPSGAAVEPAEDLSTQETGTDALPAWTQAAEVSPIKDLSLEKLENFDYLLNNFFVVDPNTTIDSTQMDAASLLSDDLKLTPDESGPQILIYHTHSQEGFADSVEGDENTSVVGVGNYLESILTDIYGYQVLHIKDAFDMMDGQLDRSKAYNYALPVIQKALDENPSIEVVIDLHRDGVPDDKHLVTEINGKPTAQIMYFNGLSRTVSNGSLDSLPNPYISDNLAFAFQLSYQAARYYPRFTRCIYLKGYRYNLHVRPRSILLEVGAQTNTVEEAMNAMEPFSVILNKVLKGE